MPRITIAIAVITAVTLSVWLWLVLPLLQQTPRDETPALETPPATAHQPALVNTDKVTAQHRPASSAPASGGAGSRLVEIYGQISDAQGQPIADVLVTEERYFFATSSDADGQYRMPLELPPHRAATLRYLRAGFAARHAQLSQSQLQQESVIELNMRLDESADTLSLPGRVANDSGVGLEGVRIEISAINSAEENDFYLTVFSDERGNFVLEAAPAATHYRLTAILAPEYPVYRNDNFYVGTDPHQIDIELKSLRFVDLAGMIRNPESVPVADFEFFITNISTGLHAERIASDSSGFFTLQQFPLGEVSLTTRGAEFHKISGLHLTAENYANLNLVVDRGDRYLSGWVSDVNGLAIAKAMVTLDATLQAAGVEYHSHRSQTTDDGGRFTFENVARGDHSLSVFATGFNKLEQPLKLQSQSEQLQLRLTRQP
jgi:protocatechuate 3,4-dioxygenase beta subunit